MPGKHQQQGFALLIMLLIVVLGSLFAVTSQLEFVSRKYARNEGTVQALNLAKEALIGYAMTYRDSSAHSTEVFGYLPCPDQIGNGSAAPNCGTADQAAVGLLPYRELGLPDLRDADGNCLWYAVSGTFKNNPKASSALLNWDAQGQFSIYGTSVVPEQGDGGAVVIIFSPGSPLSGQNRSGLSQPCNADPSQVSAYLDGNYSFARSDAIAITPGASGSSTNNDQLVWISPKEIFDKVAKRQDFGNALTATPAGHINTLTDLVKAVLEKNIQDDLVAGSNTLSLPNANTFGTPSGKRIGVVPASSAALLINGGTLVDASNNSYINYYDNWRDQYRLAMCSSLTTPCLSIAGTNCRGVLMFGGRTATVNGYSVAGQPRLTDHKSADTASLGYYFESGSGLGILNDAPTTFSGATSYSAASPSADVGTCLFPGTFLSTAEFVASSSIASSSGATSPVAGVTGGGSPSINLGTTVTPTSSRSGCVWYQTPLAMGSMLRLYFQYVIGTAGQGYTLTLADATTNNVANANPIMCGATTGSRLGYAGNVGSPSPVSPGIKPPKIGLEFDLAVTANRNDYNGDHFAFLYWGSTGDNSPTGTNSGNDDNTHYKGIQGSGSEPVNPYGLSVTTASATPVSTLSAATWSGGTVTATTTAPHGFSTGQYVLISDLTSTGFDPASSTPVAVTATDANHFTYPLAADPGVYTNGTTASRTAKTTSSGVTCSSSTVTVTTTTNHGFAASQWVNISGVTPVGYNGTFQIASIVSATEFTYALGASCPFTSSVAGFVTATNDLTSASWTSGTVTATTSASHGLGMQITGATWSAATNTTTITTASNHGYSAGQTVKIAGVSPAAFSGSYTIASVPTATTFTIAQASIGSVSPGGILVSTASWSLDTGTTTITTASQHGYSDGQNVSVSGISPVVYDGWSYAVASTTSTSFTFVQASGGWVSAGEMVNISGISPTGYNGTYPVTVTSATQFTYPLASSPGGSFSNTTFATSGFSTVKSPYFPAGGSMPTSPGIIHVRLDLTRSYSAPAHQATLTMKAYVDNLFPAAYVCSDTDFQNLARDLSALCPLRTPTIEQDNIVINDVSGAAMANVYIGFTTARGTSSADNQNISIYNVLLRSQ